MLSKEGFAMKSEIRDILKVYFRNNLLAARGLANIPQNVFGSGQAWMRKDRKVVIPQHESPSSRAV